MAYTTIDNPELYFQTKIYAGNSSTQSITLDGSENMRPDWVWIKNRSDSRKHNLYDSVRGATKRLVANDTVAEDTAGNGLTSFNSDGFTSGSEQDTNHSGNNFVAWNWSAGGASPAITYTVKVVSDSGNKYRFDDFGTSAVTLDLQEGGTYTFDQSDSSNATHPLRFYTASDKSGGEYTTGVTTTGTPGSSGAKTVITVAASAPTLYYQCSSHAGMGGQANTNSTFGSSNFGGSIQANVSANTTAGFSIVSYTGNLTDGATVGHGLGVAPDMMIIKNRSDTQYWVVYHKDLGGANYHLRLDDTAANRNDLNMFSSTAPTSSVFELGNKEQVNGSGNNIIAYCFAEKKGYSKFGSYTGNGNADGTFIYTGFKPAWVMVKRTDSERWLMTDNKRDTFNTVGHWLAANASDAESDNDRWDFLSNGFKQRATFGNQNASGSSYIYMAFAESPFVNSSGLPNNAR